MPKKILLTGATGFLGSHLARALILEGHEVVALKRQTSSTCRIKSISESLSLVDTDGLNFDVLFKLHNNIDTIIHTSTAYCRNTSKVSEIFEANTVFPLHLLEAAILANVKTFINTDTILDQ